MPKGKREKHRELSQPLKSAGAGGAGRGSAPVSQPRGSLASGRSAAATPRLPAAAGGAARLLGRRSQTALKNVPGFWSGHAHLGFSQSKMLGRDAMPDLVGGPTWGL